MTLTKMFLALTVGMGAALISACASQPGPGAQPAPPPPTQQAPSSAAAEKDTASAMEKRFQDAARSYKVVERDGKTLYCKREKRIGTTIPTMNCMTEAELRLQVESMEDYRNRARNSARCTHGPGCQAGS